MPPRRLPQRLLIRLRRILRNDQLVLAGVAIVVGLAAGAGAIGFRLLLGGVQFLAYGFPSERVAGLAAQLPWWHLLLAPTAGGLLIGLLVHLLMPGRRPEGVPAVMTGCALESGRMPLRRGLAAALISGGLLGVGASVGREGPVVHLGATLGAVAAQRLGLPAGLSRTLLGCGVAAAVAASFNAPIAGVFFALEVVLGRYSPSAFAPAVLASVTGTILSRQVYGDFPAFVLPPSMGIASALEFPAFALLGLVSAGAAMLFMAAIVRAEDLLERSRLPRPLRPALGGLLLGLIALAFPEVLGVGYETTDLALRDRLPLGLLLALIPVKTAATALSLGCGFGGGVFSPALFVGAMTGGAFGIVATAAFPAISSGHGAYTLIGMGAVAAVVLGAPISTILIVFEMSANYALTVAVMVGVVIAATVAEQTLGRSLFTWQLERRGVNLRGGREAGVLARLRVADVMRQDYATVPPSADLGTVLAALRTARYGELLVLAEAGRLVGLITLADLAAHLAPAAPAEGAPAPTAAELARPEPPVLAPDDDLERAMALIDQAGESHIAMIDRESRRVLGVIHAHEVALAYRRALLQARAEERGEPTPGRRRR